MTLTLSQLVRRFATPEAERIRTVAAQTPMPSGRLVLHDLVTRAQVEILFAQNGHSPSTHGPIVRIGHQIPLDNLAVVWDDLEERAGLLPTSWKAIEQPRIQEGKYAIFGIDNTDSLTLLLADKKRETELSGIQGLHRLKEFQTYRFFADYRDDFDPVTRLHSRTYLDRQLDMYRRIGTLTDHFIIAADLDQFKSLNEAAGYEAGDLGLRIMGEELTRALGKDGFGSRRKYGDETLSIVLKEHLLEYAGGADAWAKDLNSALAERSRELPGTFTLRLTFGVYALQNNEDPSLAKKRADQALVYARTRRAPLQVWTPELPTHEEMQSGRYSRDQDKKIVQLGTAAARIFVTGIRPDQVEPAREVLEDIIHKSQPVREEGNRLALEKIAHHLILARPEFVTKFTPDQVWESVYLTRKTLGLLTDAEQALHGDSLRITAHLSERLNLQHLFTEDPHREHYNRGLATSDVGCRFDDTVKTITAATQSQQQSRFIISGEHKPTTGEITSLGEALHLLTTNYDFQCCSGVVEFYREDKPERKIRIGFDQDRFDIAPAFAFLAQDKARRVANSLGLRKVSIKTHDRHDETEYHDFTTQDLARLEPLFWFADDKECENGEKNLARAHLFPLPNGEFGAYIPQASTLLAERASLDPEFASRIYHEPKPNSPWKDASSAHPRRTPPSVENAADLINTHYGQDGIRSRGRLPIFHGPLKSIVKLLSDLYIARDIYLQEKDGTFTIRNVRLPQLETDEPQFDEVITYYARTLNRLLAGPGKLIYQIDRARPHLAHTPRHVALPQLTLPISTRYGELFSRYGSHLD